MSRDPSPSAIPRMVPALAVLLMLGIILGCMSLTIGGSHHKCAFEEEILEQCGTVTVCPTEEQVVYYPIPYASPPNLTFKDFRAEEVRIVDQQPDHFRVLAKGDFLPSSFEVGWTARGIPAHPAPPVPPAPAVSGPPPVPPPGPPPQVRIVPDPPQP